MKQKLNVFFIAALISLTSLGLVLGWYYLTEPKSKSIENRQPIAYVKKIKEEVDRRPVRRQIWQSLNKGEPVFSGESIRTAKNSEVKIEFVDGTRSIDIEPESIVMLTQNASKDFSLDLMEGGASVQASKDSSGTLNLVQNGKTVELKGDVILSKSDKGDFEIEDQGDGKPVNFFATNNDLRLADFKLTEPSKDKNIYVDIESPFVRMAWVGSKSDLKVRVAIGTSRDQLNQTLESNESYIDLKLAGGFYYYKVFLVSLQTNLPVAVSKLQRMRIYERKMPIVISPAPYQIISIVNQAKNPTYKTQFQWTSGEYVENMIFELAKDKNLKNKIFTQRFKDKNNHEIDLAPGDYYYRLSAQFETEKTMRIGKIEKFSISLNKKVDPNTIGLNLITWNNKSEHVLPDGTEQQFFIEQPNIELSWNTKVDNAVEKIHAYKVILSNADDPLAPPRELNSSTQNMKSRLVKPGRYIASIQAVDQGSNVIANSVKKTIVVKELDMVKAPIIDGTNVLMASKDGDLNVSWKESIGAYKYYVRLYDSKGQKLKEQALDKEQPKQISYAELLPGKYSVEVFGIDLLGRAGESGRKTIEVPDESSLGAPKLKKLKVK